MVRQLDLYNRHFPANICILTLALMCLITLPFTACESEEAKPTPAPAEMTPTEESTPMPEETTPAQEKATPIKEEAKPIEYPWKSIGAHEKFQPHNVVIDGYLLEVLVDLGRKLPTSEADALKEKVTLIDEKGKVYKPSILGSGGIKITTRDAQENVIFEWSADFSYTFSFVVKSDTMNYRFQWSGYPPLDIGNPFEEPFILESP